ncbi:MULTISPECIES: DUF3040 domain-containing protein [Streptosporangium]|uniref:DUF3040 domain-containing protein n=1 Tax=Streptosporangium brasiliense TaxID=47480 RepID=A0ABT9QZY6_9ACTN|nr:DUF3040 domain-containing protein [Streptosporangium brasiliense]MDP9861785.1 hypothetical protein [Streptosporangium brasiliense]
MGLSTREKRTLDGIADRLYAEDPDLAESLSSFATGLITAEALPARRRPFSGVLLPVVLLAALMAIMAVVLPPISGTGADPGPTSTALTRG